jgi:hypothetical protein
LLQTGNSVTGALVLGDGCSGVGPVSGTVNGQSLQLDVNEFGQDLTLTASLPSTGVSGNFMAGQFSTLAGACIDNSTGTWSAVQIPPLTGTFHGTMMSSDNNGTIDVTGSFTQGGNAGASNATLSGSLSTTGVPPFCSYVTSASITGVITGTSVSLYFFGPDGTPLNTGPISGTFATDGTSMTIPVYGFAAISKSCTGDSGMMQLSFP